VCIDLPASFTKLDLYSLGMRIDPSGTRLTLGNATGTLAVIDARTFKVGPPPRAATSAAARVTTRGGSGVPLAAILAPAALLLIAIGAIVRSTSTRRRAHA
jgi:hypothetical protein